MQPSPPATHSSQATGSPLTQSQPQEQGRADFYAVAGALLLAPPPQRLLTLLAAAPPLQGSGAPALQQAWQGLRAAAAGTSAAAASEAYAALFDAVGQPVVDPSASRYLAGALHAWPLAALRADLRRLGIVRRPEAACSEDHLGALCETMRLLITGAPGLPPQPLAQQQQFFARHLAPWAGACCDDIRRTPGAGFYIAWADFADAFFQTEAAAFAIDGDALPDSTPAGLWPDPDPA